MIESILFDILFWRCPMVLMVGLVVVLILYLGKQ